MTTRILILISFAVLAETSCSTISNRTNVNSPDGQIRVSLNSKVKSGIPSLKLQKGKTKEILQAEISLSSLPDLANREVKVTGSEKKKVTGSWINEFGEKREIPDNYNQLIINMLSGEIQLNLIIRAYNEGMAFSWEVPEQEGVDSLIINDEKIVFHFPADHFAWSAPRAQAQYSRVPLSGIHNGAERPLVIEIDSTLTIALAEAKVVDFARMKFEADTGNGISIRTRLGSPVAKACPFQSPWRVVMTGKDAGDLLEKNYLLLNLNDTCKVENTSWIKPGKALREVTLTTTGAMALVDFISRHKMQYIEFDAGWYGYEYDDSSDARCVNVDPKRSKGPLDLPAVISYARAKDVGVLLYVNRRALERQLDELLPLYRSWGVAGIKFGFVQVGTQEATSWMHEAIRKCAEYQLVVDVHDEYRPTGFSRTWPNFLTQEGIRGDEESPTNSHTLITMFTRMLAGAGDNTICYFDKRVDEKMGSHASQLAKAVCIFSPLQFLYWYDRLVPEGREDELAGKPNYLSDEPELEFFDKVPTVWDETRVLHSSIGEYGVIARRKGEEWFIGAINGDQPGIYKIDFSFLGNDSKYLARIYSDMPDLKTRTRVKIDSMDVSSDLIWEAKLGTNTGMAMHLVPLE
ncbi:MAG: glycoside hydrolase family 97 catalytic domain-containing protein [Bacteroidales bacterium]|nr:glycoside hydrolase family 97 catalytic domain-containing protein [Bacteroidales bacterium]